jgi:hypothetical protein
MLLFSPFGTRLIVILVSGKKNYSAAAKFSNKNSPAFENEFFVVWSDGHPIAFFAPILFVAQQHELAVNPADSTATALVVQS